MEGTEEFSAAFNIEGGYWYIVRRFWRKEVFHTEAQAGRFETEKEALAEIQRQKETQV